MQNHENDLKKIAIRHKDFFYFFTSRRFCKSSRS